MRAHLAAFVVAALAVACVRARAFRCDDDDQCVDGEARGFCMDSRFCAYPDAMCPDELRYEDNAGDGLAGTCVDWTVDCEAYCDLGAEACSGDPSFQDPQWCRSQCAQLPLEGDGNSIECRFAWLDGLEDGASVEDACWSGAIGGGEDCLDPTSASCDLLCETLASACGPDATLQGFDCWEVCSGLRPGTAEDTEGDTIGCRVQRMQDTTRPVVDRCEEAAAETSTCVDEV
jgi:hypothetical protein